MNKSVRDAFCGIVAALGTVLMFLTGLISIGTYAFPALAGVLNIVIVIEMGTRLAWPVYAATSILSVLVAGDKEAAMLFVLFFGYYPIIKAVLERTGKKALAYVLKFVIFNAAMILGFFLAIRLLGVPEESFTFAGIYLPWIFLVLGNLAFLLYDYVISGLVVTYYHRFHKIIAKWMNVK